MEHVATPSWAMLAYLVSGVLFILALRGLSSPSTSQRGNRFGMAGMLIAVVTTLSTNIPLRVGSECDHWNSHPAPNVFVTCDPLMSTDGTTVALILGAIGIGAVIGLTTCLLYTSRCV